MVVRELYKLGIDLLTEHEIETPNIDARVLLEKTLGAKSGQLILFYGNQISENDKNLYLSDIKKRCKNTPLSYITNVKEFYSLPFYVKEGVLIPRPETENLVLSVIDNLPHKKASSALYPEIADLCSGSGCIGISLAKNISCDVSLYEISDTAIEVSYINCNRLGAENIKIIKKDILNEGLEKSFDVIVSNPPYIPVSDMEGLMPEVRDYEPRLSLTDNSDGLLFYRRIADLAKKHLNYGGIVAVEVGINQHVQVSEIFSKAFGGIQPKIITDYFGIERVVLLKRGVECGKIT